MYATASGAGRPTGAVTARSWSPGTLGLVTSQLMLPEKTASQPLIDALSL